MACSISQIRREEIPALLEMVRELARFEQLEHTVEATPELLSESLFGPQAVAGALLARADNQVAGYALYFFTFSSFTGRPGIWLEDLYVRPQFRRQGIGRALIVEVGRIGVARNCQRYEWTALNWNKNALEFYGRLGASVMDQWVLIRMDAAGLRRLTGSSF